VNLERLFDQVGHDLGWHDHNMRRYRPYGGQPHTQTGERGRQEIRGITMRDLRDCFIRAFIHSHQVYKPGTIEELQPNFTLAREADKGEHAAICESDLYRLVGDIDPMAVAQNLTCEVEKLMGIFPNVPELKVREA
jgi:hypothetical protein